MTAPGGHIFWWYTPSKFMLDAKHVCDVLNFLGFTGFKRLKTSNLQSFTYAIEIARRKFIHTYKIDQIEKGKRKVSYGISHKKIQTRYKCKRVIHHHLANITCNEVSGNVIKTQNNPVCNYIHNKYEELRGKIPISKLTMPLIRHIRENMNVVSLSSRGGPWFMPPNAEHSMQRINAIFSDLWAKDSAYKTIRCFSQYQEPTKEFLDFLYFALCRRLPRIYEENRSLGRKHHGKRTESDPVSESTLTGWLGKVANTGKIVKLYKDLYAFEFEELDNLERDINSEIIGTVTRDPIQQAKIRTLYGVK